MCRFLGLAAAGLLLSGCFVFDNPYENGLPPAVNFQIAVQGGTYAGAYLWNPISGAYEAHFGSVFCKIYMNSSGTWLFFKDITQLASSSASFLALPPTLSSGWSPSDKFISIDDSMGGICAASGPPDAMIGQGVLLHVTFVVPGTGSSWTYLWQRSPSQAGYPPSPLGTASTYQTVPSDAGNWISVVVSNPGGSGSVTSQSVKVF